MERLCAEPRSIEDAWQVRRHARRVAARIAPMPLAEQVDAEFAKREVRMFSDGGVMATIEAVLPAPDAMAVWNALTACAHAQDRPEDARTLAHKRADALTSWANRALEDPSLPTHHGRRRLETQVVVDLPTLLILADNPGELVGFGPIPATMARQLAADSCWRRLVTHPVTGHLLDYGTELYEPPRAIRDYVLHRDQTCRFPGCSQPAYRTDLDHTVAFDGSESGGSTASTNLHCLCRRHHRLKTHGAWTVSTADSETDELLWTSPRGKEYSSIPPPRWTSSPRLRTVPDFIRPTRAPMSRLDRRSKDGCAARRTAIRFRTAAGTTSASVIQRRPQPAQREPAPRQPDPRHSLQGNPSGPPCDPQVPYLPSGSGSDAS